MVCIHDRIFLINLTVATLYGFVDRCAPCRLELRQLTYRKQEQHAAALRAQHWADNIAWKNSKKKIVIHL